MWRSKIRSGYYLGGALLLLLLLMGGWLLTGRLAIFQTSSYITLFGATWPQELYQQNVLWLPTGTEVKQEFVSEYPGLYKISIFLTGQEGLNEDVVITFHLRESCNAQSDLRRVAATISAADIANDLFYPFTFTPIDESTNQKFCFILVPSLAQGEKTVGVRASILDVYAGGKALYKPLPKINPVAAKIEPINQLNSAFTHKVFLPIILVSQSNKKTNIDIGFQLHYNGRPLETIGVFMTRLTKHKPYFWGSICFYIFLFIVYISALYLLIRISTENRR